MSAQEFDVIWRAFNGIAGLVALVLFVRSTCRSWGRLTGRTRLYAEVIGAFLAATTYGSLENILQQNPIGFRTVLATAAIIWTLMAVLFTDPELERS